MTHTGTAGATASAASGVRAGSKRKQWHDVTPDGAAARVLAWHGRSAWLASVAERAESKPRSARTRLAVAGVMADAADRRTGRGMGLSVATIAERAGVSERSVRVVRAWLAAEGLAVELLRGRHLTAAERVARKASGGWGITTASMWCLTGDSAAHSVSRRDTAVSSKTSVTKRKRRTKSSPNRNPRPITLQRLAARVLADVRGLDTGRHVGALADGLAATGAGAWTLGDVLAALSADGRAWSAADARDPLAWTLARLRRAIAGGFQPGSPRTVSDAEQRAARRTQRAAERAAEAQAAASNTGAGLAAARAVREALAAGVRRTYAERIAAATSAAVFA